jgi:hypothetical protein
MNKESMIINKNNKILRALVGTKTGRTTTSYQWESDILALLLKRRCVGEEGVRETVDRWWCMFVCVYGVVEPKLMMCLYLCGKSSYFVDMFM